MPDPPKTGRSRHARQSQTRRGLMSEFPWGCQHPMSAHSVQLVRMTKKALPPLLLPNATPASPGRRAKGPPRCPYLQVLLLSTLHSCGKPWLPARCSLLVLGS